MRLLQLCDAIDAGYASGLCMVDDAMVPLFKDLGDSTDQIRNLLELLDRARNGLAWYIDMNPGQVSDVDHEVIGEIEAALLDAGVQP